MPAPVLSDAQQKKLHEDQLVITRMQQYWGGGHGTDLLPNVSCLRDILPELVERITDGDIISVDERAYWADCLSWQMLHGETPEEHQSIIEKCRRKQETLPVIDRLNKGIDDDQWRGAPYLRKFGGAVERLSEHMPAKEWDQKFEALAIACFLGEDHDDYKNWEKETTLAKMSYDDLSQQVDYIMSNRTKVDAVLPQVLGRGTFDFQLLKQMVESPTPALLDGML
jgi:hypothetical protein